VMREFERFKETNEVSPEIVTINMWAPTNISNYNEFGINKSGACMSFAMFMLGSW
jgi:hypothetical protein